MTNNNSLINPTDTTGRSLAPYGTTATGGPGSAVIDPNLETSFETPRRVGLMIAMLVFGVFGVWAVLAPIEGAANAPGTITVSSYKKQIQHLEGGIVKDILVQNGDMVHAGDVLLELDATQSLAQLAISNGQLLSLVALEARLIAERDGLDAVEYPPLLASSPPQGPAEMAAQDQVFQARKTTEDGAAAVLEQRIEQLESQIRGLRALQESKRALAASYDEEITEVRSLLAEGFADKLRLRELERNHELLTGEAAELDADIASTEIQVGETRMQIIQRRNEFQSQVAGQLATTQSDLKDTRERVTALTDIVTRTEIRSPDDGIVNNLSVHTIGGVIPPGQPIAEIVPQSDELLIEAHVAPRDIDRVAIGQEATVRLSSLSRRSVPILHGTVRNLSADALTDPNGGPSYYLARVAITPESLTALEDLELVPGMPAEVLINTGARTFLQYITKPLSNAMARSFIED